STTDELDATSALAKGLRSVANSLCDVLVKLTSDMKVWGAESGHNAFFEQDMEGRKFTDILEERDITRFNALLNLVSKDHVPACLPVTIRRSQTTSECHLLLVDTGRREPRYLLGIRVESDQAHSMMLPADNYSEVIQSSGMVDYLGLVPSVTRIGQGNNSYNHQMMMQDADFSFTTYPKNAPPPPPQFTPIKARALSVRKLMPRWNLLRDPEACCMFHTNARSLGAVIDHLLTAPCDPLWSTLSGGQCHRCKCMCTEAWQRCVVCGLPNPEFESQQMQQAFQMQQSFQPVGGGIEEDTRIEAPISEVLINPLRNLQQSGMQVDIPRLLTATALFFPFSFRCGAPRSIAARFLRTPELCHGHLSAVGPFEISGAPLNRPSVDNAVRPMLTSSTGRHAQDCVARDSAIQGRLVRLSRLVDSRELSKRKEEGVDLSRWEPVLRKRSEAPVALASETQQDIMTAQTLQVIQIVVAKIRKSEVEDVEDEENAETGGGEDDACELEDDPEGGDSDQDEVVEADELEDADRVCKSHLQAKEADTSEDELLELAEEELCSHTWPSRGSPFCDVRDGEATERADPTEDSEEDVEGASRDADHKNNNNDNTNDSNNNNNNDNNKNNNKNNNNNTNDNNTNDNNNNNSLLASAASRELAELLRRQLQGRRDNLRDPANLS
ncbi:unnamed protein product, partial [Polarella glacialis]